ncbi:MAG TPA: bifunctional oligoribonuclease/PAP phosphatase NrnA [Candidatus Faecalibacterium faecipullorum]|uniref:Bifunctional oligoribonuclease/PAP phosphatase NrnA n=1 Tax=Candidatus Faecalibacterium faecipullorum TaxID=2838578 RepID=A0A9D2MDM8_9FIRM|nr:bifunctional oligoribonuclease/PAP phosphatase NrnA [Candidatus Faecalibacterium faecipullorum]
MTQPLPVQQAAARLKEAGSVLILCHKNPDGDTLGCASALYHALASLGRTAAVLCADPIPPRFGYLRPRLYRGDFEPALTVAVDVASLQLLGAVAQTTAGPRRVDLCIDHHAGNSGYAQYSLVDPDAAAAAELLCDVIEAMGVQLTPQIAACLYTGLATDTGCFRFANTTAQTHRAAARLIEAGARVDELNTILFATKSRGQMEAERVARSHLEYHLDGRCALLWLTREEIAASGADPADLDELTSLPAGIEGVRAGLTFRQQPGGSWRVSIRTAQGVDACAIARRLGGGGHLRAAGCELQGALDNVKAAVLAETAAVLDGPEPEQPDQKEGR